MVSASHIPEGSPEALIAVNSSRLYPGPILAPMSIKPAIAAPVCPPGSFSNRQRSVFVEYSSQKTQL